MPEHVRKLEVELQRRLKTLNPCERACASARLVDLVWNTIRPYVRCQCVVWLGNLAAALVKADLLRRSGLPPAERCQRWWLNQWVVWVCWLAQSCLGLHMAAVYPP